MTIHNLKFQGMWDAKKVRDITGLPEYYFVPDKLSEKIDAIYASMHFERVFLPEVTTRE